MQKHPNCLQLTSERLSENSAIYHIVRATLCYRYRLPQSHVLVFILSVFTSPFLVSEIFELDTTEKK